MSENNNREIESTQKYDALALLSGGLDSILAARTIQEQGLKVKCLHFTSPFFGHPDKLAHWEKIYDLDLEAVDIGEEYASLIKNYPTYGFGSCLNPCVDCKILMMTKTRELLDKYQASVVISGEVLGQRPMSQRRDSLNVIRRDAQIKDILLRPLCALHMDETKPEREGLVKRELLHNFSGRGRQPQLQLAQKLGITEIPTPAGGCKLTEKDTSARYWNVLSKHEANATNFTLANIGRQFWHDEKNQWLVVGRNQDDNLALEKNAHSEDFVMRVDGFPSPLALMRPFHKKVISNDDVQHAAQMLSSYSPKAVKFAEENNTEIDIILLHKNEQTSIRVKPLRSEHFLEPIWENARKELKIWEKALKSNN